MVKRRRGNSGRVAAAAAAGVVLATTILVMACESTEPVAPTPVRASSLQTVPEGVVRARENKNFIESSRVAIQGWRRNDGNCAFMRTYRLGPGEHAGERVVEENTSDCAFVVARGAWTKVPEPRATARVEHGEARHGHSGPSAAAEF